ncbi:phospholipase effector Tle1 domain-containing protein [Sphingomonas colocasiae]|uniref:DUF2235 domain-containing protein n=1 Tax=Sphingomonas colocasiae TaxID=1848973 RepID=A0ABS7PPT9_9SPHN|nr:DUF2235 domain-containing protein [Sphingomonas colocasiae]
MAKNIIICCDGTGNGIEVAISNVLKLYRVLGKSDRQRVHYSQGSSALEAAWQIQSRLWRSCGLRVPSAQPNDCAQGKASYLQLCRSQTGRVPLHQVSSGQDSDGRADRGSGRGRPCDGDEAPRRDLTSLRQHGIQHFQALLERRA